MKPDQIHRSKQRKRERRVRARGLQIFAPLCASCGDTVVIPAVNPKSKIKNPKWTLLTLCFLATTLLFPAAAQQNQIIERGPHHRVHQVTKGIQTPFGLRTETNRIVELQGGLHRWTDQGWMETHPRIELFEGGAVVRNLQYGLIVAPNLATPNALDLSLPDGARVQGHLLGIMLSDGNRSALIAEVKDCAGVIGGPEQNELTFPDAMDGLDATVKYIVQRDRISQLVTLHNAFHPGEWDLTENAVLEILSEFKEFPELRKEARPPMDGVATEHLSFGAMEFVTGRAFALGHEDNPVAVAKTWEVFEGQRTFLVEKIPWRSIAAELAQLPPIARNDQKKDPVRKVPVWKDTLWKNMARDQLRLPERQQARAAIKPIQMAALTGGKRGYVLDWELVSSVNSNLWKGDTTYYIAGDISVKTNIFEGGCVIKFAPTNMARLLVTGPATFLTTNYAPLIMTARDDHSVGAAIGSSALSGYYANKGLELDYYASGILYDLHDVRLSHATLGISFFQGRGHTARNIQIVRCLTGLQGYHTDFQMLNGLLHNCALAFNASDSANTTGSLQHVTFNQCSNLNSSTLTLFVTNSLLVAVTNITSFTGAYNGTNSDPTLALQALGACSNYLASGSAYRNAGTTNIEATLRSSLKRLTTYPPIVAGHLVILANTNLVLSLQAGRDTDTPDLGWHASPIDYVFGGTYLTNSTITLNPGTVVGLYSPTNAGNNYYGIGLSDGAKIFSEGSPTNLNRIVRYNTVQEQGTTTWNTTPVDHILSDLFNVAHTPEARFRFTEWSIPASDTRHFAAYYGTDLALAFSDCQFFGGIIKSERPRVSATNCLFHRVATVLEGADYAINPYFRNCTFYGGSLEAYAWAGGTWAFTNNLFHGTTISQDGTISHDYNAYVTNATGQRLTSSAAHDVATNSFSFLTGTLGRFYQPTNSLFINMGNTNAHLLALYHYTVLTNNVKETNTLVDIGFHYVATDANGNPLDEDSDGTPDHLEDLNSNGSVDSGETDWQSAGDGGLRVLITRPSNGSILP
jgi:hypothetical protein